MDAARAASHEHPARVLGVILGDARGAADVNAQVGTGSRLDRRDRADPAQRRGGQAPRVGRAAAAAARLPRRDLVAHRRPDGPRRRPARRPRPAPDHRRGRGHPRQARKAIHTQCASYAPGNTDLAWTRLTPWRALLAAALDQHHAEGDRRRRSPPSGSARAPTCWSPGWPTGSRCTSTRTNSDGPGHHRGGARDQARARSGSAGPTASWPRSPPPASPTGRSR